MAKLYIGCDHNGVALKNKLVPYLGKKGYNVESVGAHTYKKGDDYPDYALKLCKKVLETDGKGILICGSGQGMDRVANKVKGIYASICWNERTAVIAREHGDTNVLCIPGLFVKAKEAQKIAYAWLTADSPKEKRHIRRIKKIKQIEESYPQSR